LAEEAHGPQRWARHGREELPIPNRLAEDGVGDIIGAQLLGVQVAPMGMLIFWLVFNVAMAALFGYVGVMV
jgi:hypothetical protein